MKAVIVVIIIIYCATFPSEAQKIKNSARTKRLDSLDLRKLKQSGIVGYTLIKHKDGKNIELLEDSNDYQENITNSKNPFGICNHYYKDLNLKSNVQLFYDEPIGIYKEYDHKGHVIKKEDCDSLYKFSVYSLIRKFKKEYNLDLSIPKERRNVIRNYDSTIGSLYIVHFDLNILTFREITVNGNSGKVISNIKGNYVE